MIKFSNNIVAHEFPDGFFWINKKDSLIKNKFSMLETNDIEQKIINIAGRGIEESILFERLSEYPKTKIKNSLKRLLDDKILVNGGSNPIITGDSHHCYPTHVMIELTDFCNLNCLHCCKNGSAKESSFIDKEKIIKTINELVSNGILALELTGGRLHLSS